MLSLAPVDAWAQCAVYFQPGAILSFTTAREGAVVNTGHFLVTRVEGDFVQLEQRAAGTQWQVGATFYGGIQGARVYFANAHPNWPEFWAGACGPNGVSGHAAGHSFQLTLVTAPAVQRQPSSSPRPGFVDPGRGGARR